MLAFRTHNPAGWFVLGAVCALAPTSADAVSSVRLAGTVAGHVRDAGGVPQMGAAVTLYNRLDRVMLKLHTNSNGEFQFMGLLPDVYSVRVTLNSFAPAFKQNILVQPGMRSLLNVKLTSLFSTIQFSYPSIDNGSIMTDEWKWVLRSATSARPVLRFTNGKQLDPDAVQTRSAMFADTRGLLKVSAGEGGLATGTANEADLGTAFALATSLYGNTLQVSGNVGYGSQTGVPTASFRTSYSRNIAGGSPEVSVTMRQLYLPARLAAAVGGNQEALPMLRTMSAGLEDRTQVADGVTLQYGFTLDSVQFLDRLNYFSPYARLTYSLGDAGDVEFAYTSGNARPDLAGEQSPESDLQHDLSTLGLFPNVTLRDGRPRIQRGQEYELTYSRHVGTRTYSLSAYHETIANMALPLLAPSGYYAEGDILPDLFSGSAVFNAGDHQSSGYAAALTQNLGEHLRATVIVSSGGALSAEGRELVSSSPDELRSMIRWGRRHAATARITATSPWTGTHMIASYQWANDHSAMMAGNLYSTRGVRPVPGFNLYIRQPIPGPGILPWKMEATADLRNLLAQGYLPFQTAGGQRVTVVEWPRSFRGGLSFIF